MEKNSHYFIVGVFVSLTLMALTFFVIWLAGTHDTRSFERYTIYFRDPVSGLKDSALVQYRGVDVGRVKHVRISSDSMDLIKADIEVEKSTPITRTTEASLATQGVTGMVYIDLTTEEGDTTPPAMVPGEPYPVIRGRGTQLSKLFQDIPAITTQILTLMEKLNSVFDDEGTQSLSVTLANIEKMSHNVNQLLNDQNLQNTSAMLSNLAEGSEGLGDLIERFNKTADEIDEAVSSLSSVVSENRESMNKFAGTGLNQITEMSRETRDMARAIRRLADTLEQDPSKLLYQPHYRGVEVQP